MRPDAIMTIVRYPPQLDEHEAEFTRLDDHLSPDAVHERLAHLDRLAVGGAFATPLRQLGEARRYSRIVIWACWPEAEVYLSLFTFLLDQIEAEITIAC